LHAQEATLDLIRWFLSEGVAGADRQGQLMRMISAVATESGLRDPELIRAIIRYSTELRGMGWIPEQTVTNIGKALAGKAQEEARKTMTGLIEGMKAFTGEKAVEDGRSEGSGRKRKPAD
jgi:hypothetical protein